MNFDWAAREGSPLATSQFGVRWNGEDIAVITPDNYDVNRLKIVISAGKTNEVKLVGLGRSDSYGTTVANFGLFRVFRNEGYPGFVNNN